MAAGRVLPAPASLHATARPNGPGCFFVPGLFGGSGPILTRIPAQGYNATAFSHWRGHCNSPRNDMSFDPKESGDWPDFGMAPPGGRGDPLLDLFGRGPSRDLAPVDDDEDDVPPAGKVPVAGPEGHAEGETDAGQTAHPPRRQGDQGDQPPRSRRENRPSRGRTEPPRREAAAASHPEPDPNAGKKPGKTSHWARLARALGMGGKSDSVEASETSKSSTDSPGDSGAEPAAREPGESRHPSGARRDREKTVRGEAREPSRGSRPARSSRQVQADSEPSAFTPPPSVVTGPVVPAPGPVLSDAEFVEFEVEELDPEGRVTMSRGASGLGANRDPERPPERSHPPRRSRERDEPVSRDRPASRGARRDAPAQDDRDERPARTARAERPERPERGNRGDRTASSDRDARGERGDRPGRGAKAVRGQEAASDRVRGFQDGVGPDMSVTGPDNDEPALLRDDLPDDSDLHADPTVASPDGEGDEEPRRGRRRRRRGRRGRGQGGEAGEPESGEEVAATPRGERRPPASSSGGDEFDDDLDSAEIPDRDEDGEGPKKPITTWATAIGSLIDKNLKNRREAPPQRSRGRNGDRGGYDRGGGDRGGDRHERNDSARGSERRDRNGERDQRDDGGGRNDYERDRSGPSDRGPPGRGGGRDRGSSGRGNRGPRR